MDDLERAAHLAHYVNLKAERQAAKALGMSGCSATTTPQWTHPPDTSPHDATPLPHSPNPYSLDPEIIDEYPRPLCRRPCAPFWGACPSCGAAGNIVDTDYNWYLNPYNHGDSDPRSWWRRLVLDWPPWTDGEDALILFTIWGGLLLCVAALGALLLTWIGLLP